MLRSLTAFLALVFLAACTSEAPGSGPSGAASPSAAQYLKAIGENDEPMPRAGPDDWLSRHGEAGQTFGEYRRDHPQPLSGERQVIYLLPLGDVAAGADSGLIGDLRDYLAICFQRPVRLLPPLPERFIPDNMRRTGADGSVQLHSGFITAQLLPGRLPADGLTLMAVSNKDLYPADDWNYVFGQASYKEHVGVTSLYRLKGPPGDSLARLRFLERLLKTASHEIGHMLWLPHCIEARCLMNGSNNLAEADRQPLRPCSDCQRKLCWALGYDPRRRVTELQVFLEQKQLQTAAGVNRRDRNHR